MELEDIVKFFVVFPNEVGLVRVACKGGAKMVHNRVEVPLQLPKQEG